MRLKGLDDLAEPISIQRDNVGPNKINKKNN